MIAGAEPPAVARPVPATLLLASLLFLLPLLPPETRPTAAVACSIAIVGLVLVAPPGAGSPWLAALVVAGGALGLVAARAALAPGAAVEPLAVALGAAVAGLAARTAVLRGASARAGAVAIAAAGGAVSLHAIVQKAWGLDAMAARLAAEPDLPDRAIALARLGSGRAFAAFPTPAALGGFLVLAGPVTVGLAMAARQRRERVVWISIVLLEAAALWASASGSAAAALAGAIALSGAFHPRLRRGLVVAVAAAALLVILVVAARPALLHLDDPAGPWRLRAGNFRAAVAMAADHPIAGVGPGGFGELYASYRAPGDNETRHVHDLPLELAAEIGLPAGLLVAGLFFFVFLGPIAVARTEPVWKRGAAVGLAAFALHNLLDFTAFLPSLFGAACLLRGAVFASEEKTRPDAPTPRVLVGLATATGVLAATLVAATALARDERLAARLALAAGDGRAAREHASRAARLAPWDVDAAVLRTRVELGPAGEDGERLAEARALADRAVALSPVRPTARELRATIRSKLGDLPGAHADLVQAARLHPVRGDYAAARDRLATVLGNAIAAAHRGSQAGALTSPPE